MSNNIHPYNEKGQSHGFWECYWLNDGSLYYKAYYINGKAIGYEEYYSRDANMNIKIKQFFLK